MPKNAVGSANQHWMWRQPSSIALCAVCTLIFSGAIQGQSVRGVIRDNKAKTVPFAEVVVERGGQADRVSANYGGEYVSSAHLGGGQVRVSVTAKGFEPASVEATLPVATPSCTANFILFKKGKSGSSPTGVLACDDPTPYSDMLAFQSDLAGSNGELITSQPGQAMGINSHFQPGGPTITSGFLFGNYYFQTKPPTPRTLVVRAGSAPTGSSWSISNNALTLRSVSVQEARIDFPQDGEAILTLQNEGKTLLRVHLVAQTFQDVWQVKAFRVTETDKIIDEDGRVSK